MKSDFPPFDETISAMVDSLNRQLSPDLRVEQFALERDAGGNKFPKLPLRLDVLLEVDFSEDDPAEVWIHALLDLLEEIQGCLDHFLVHERP